MDDPSIMLLYPHPRHSPTRDEIISSKIIIKTLDEDILKLEGHNTELQVQLQRARDNHASYVAPFHQQNDLVYCGTTERLKFVLKCVGSSPLSLVVVLWRSRPEILQPITSQIVLKSLEIRDFSDESTTDSEDDEAEPEELEERNKDNELILQALEGLNTSHLKSFMLNGYSYCRNKRFLDLAMRSSAGQIPIEITIDGSGFDDLLLHDLFRRATVLNIYNEPNDSSSEQPIYLPHLKSLKLQGDQASLDLFNLKRLENLILYWKGNSQQSPVLAKLSATLTTLTLDGIKLTKKEFAGQAPHSLPNLVRLCLRKVKTEGPLKKYLLLPKVKLKHVEVDDVYFYPKNHRLRHGKDKEVNPSPLWEMLFVGNVPTNLETFSLSNMPIDQSLVLALQSSAYLRILTIKAADISSFFPSFIKHLKRDTNFFPALREIRMKLEWPWCLDMAYEHFSDYCDSRKPHIDLYGEVGWQWIRTGSLSL
ncbi:hypothetical protein CPB86DRAFT_875445 [Serendipita vermifera]|nr:hypothetical protein CPB86DRAFT_875445 [Serendipita vermifera]